MQHAKAAMPKDVSEAMRLLDARLGPSFPSPTK